MEMPIEEHIEQLNIDREMEVGGKYYVDRTLWRAALDYFIDWLDKHGFDSYGDYGPDMSYEDSDNEIFAIRAYYWGDDPGIENLPNFEYKKTGFKMAWYKYPFRSTYMNKDIKPEDFIDMLDEIDKEYFDKKV